MTEKPKKTRSVYVTTPKGDKRKLFDVNDRIKSGAGCTRVVKQPDQENT